MIAKFRNLHISTQLFVLLILLNYLDFYTTKILVDAYGFEAEGNPVLLYLMNEMDTVYAILLLKALLLGFYLFWHIQLPDVGGWISKKVITFPISILNIAFGSVCVWNLYLIYHTVLIV